MGGESDPASFDDVWNDNSFQSAKTELEKMAKAGTLDEKTFSNNEKYRELLDATGRSAKETCDHIYSLVEAEGETGTGSGKPFSKQEMISQINGLSEGFEELDKIMNSMKDTKTPFDYAILDDKKFKDNFSKLGDAYTDFVEKIASSPKDVKGCQSAFDNLATAFVNNSGILNGLSEDTATLTADMLKNMGVANAEEVVIDALGKKKAAEAAETANLANMLDSEVDAFLMEQGATADTIDSFKAYIAEKQLANFAIDPNGDIDALNAIMVKLGAAGQAWKNYYRYKKDLDAINNGETVDMNGTKMYH